MQTNLVEIKTQAELTKHLPAITKLKVIVVDTETSGLSALLDTPVLLQIGNPDIQYVIHWYDVDIKPLKSYLESPDVLKIFQNHKFDYKFLKHHTGITVRHNIYDTMLAELLITGGVAYETQQTSMEAQAKKYLNISLDKETRNEFIGWDRRKKLSPEAIKYSAIDVIVPYDIYRIQKGLIKKWGLEFVANLEFTVSSDLGDMELNGMYIDSDKWLALAEQSIDEAKDIKKNLDKFFLSTTGTDLFGSPLINYNSHAQLREALLKMKIDLPDTKEETLKKYADAPVIAALLEHRKWQKRISTYGKSFLDHINPDTGRVHTSYWQIVSTGRVSSINPNLQNIPTPKKKGDLNFRAPFVAQRGRMLTIDYSGCELRILAELSKDPTLVKAFSEELVTGIEADVHSMIATLMFGVPVSKTQNKELRRKTKELNFGLIYGMSAFSLGKRIGINKKEAKKLVATYFKTLPGIAKYLEQSAHNAVHKGYARTISGRMRKFIKPDMNKLLKEMDSYKASREYDSKISHIERQGKNSPIQGTNGDIIKQAIINVSKDIRDNKRDVMLVAQIHDELVFEGDVENYENTAVELMLSAQETFLKTIPPRVTHTIDESWSK